ncbi:MAG: biotin transporter BioY [Pseudomonadota bacterium]
MTTPSLAQTLWRTDQSSLLRSIILVVFGTLLLWVSAKIKVPFYPVQQTMQTFVVLMIAAVYGWRLGVITILAYLAEGAAGLPVFSGTPERGIGIAYMVGPTAGYLVGFVVATLTVGFLAQRGWDRSIWRTAVMTAIGHCIIYAFGLLWLGTLIGWDKPVLELGMYPFLLGDVVKVALATALLPLAWHYIRR